MADLTEKCWAVSEKGTRYPNRKEDDSGSYVLETKKKGICLPDWQVLGITSVQNMTTGAWSPRLLPGSETLGLFLLQFVFILHLILNKVEPLHPVSSDRTYSLASTGTGVNRQKKLFRLESLVIILDIRS